MAKDKDKDKDPKKTPSEKEPAVAVTRPIAVPKERMEFKKLLLSNPNFFGTFPDLGTVVKPLKGDTTFE